MKKNEIIKTIKKYNLPNNKYLIISGAALVLYGIKEETNDIDIAVSKDLNDYLLNKYNCTIDKENVYFIDNIINFSTNYYEENKNYINDLPVQKIDSIIKLKNKLNRDKDRKDLNKIDKYLDKNILSLAYLGDSVYSLYIRNYLINKYQKVNTLNKETNKYVSAKGQSKYLKQLLDENFFNEEEKQIIKRGRNHKSHNSKTTDIITYKNSTGLEALIGYLYQKKEIERIEEIMNKIVGD